MTNSSYIDDIGPRLRGTISEQTDYMLFDEAMRCLRTGALRAAYIVAWLSAAESLRGKFVAMSSRDSEIRRVLAQIEQAEAQDRPTDRLLLSKAKEFGLIDTEEHEKLENIRRMRNLYAHPTQTGPSEAEVIAALDVTVEAVLRKPPLLRHGYVNALCRSLFEDRHFLDDVPERIQEYAVGVSKRIHPDVVPFLFKQLVDGLEKTTTDPSLGFFLRRGLLFGIAFMSEVKPDMSAEHWNVPEIVQSHPTAGPLLLSIPVVWALMTEQCQDMVLGYLVEPVVENKVVAPMSEGLRTARALVACLTPRQVERLMAAEKRTGTSVLQKAGMSLRDYWSRILDGLKFYDWDHQNTAAEGLHKAGPDECRLLPDEAQELLGRNITQAADGGAWGPMSFITTYLKREVWPVAFVRGLLTEALVNEDRSYRLKEKYFEGVVQVVLLHPKAGEIVGSVVDEVAQSKPKTGYGMEYHYDTAIAILSKVRALANTEQQPSLEALSRAILEAKERMSKQSV